MGDSSEKTDLVEQLKAATELLESVSKDRGLLHQLSVEDRTRLLTVAGEVYCPDVAQRRRLLKAKHKERKKAKLERDQKVLSETGIRSLRRKPVFTSPNVYPPKNFEQQVVDDPGFREVVEPQNCYICKQDYQQVHHFYDQLCPDCATLNYHKRTESADLQGRVALLTGGRVKIGYQAGIKLLRSGAQLIVTTRFPRDAAARYADEPDFEDWADRLEVFGLDLRHTPSVEAFCKHMFASRDRLDFIVSNACQTVRRPPDFYRHMMERETSELKELPAAQQRLLGGYEGLRGYNLLPEGEAALVARKDSAIAGLTHAAELSQAPLLPEELEAQKGLFPEGRLDQDLQQVDLRDRNSLALDAGGGVLG